MNHATIDGLAKDPLKTTIIEVSSEGIKEIPNLKDQIMEQERERFMREQASRDFNKLLL